MTGHLHVYAVHTSAPRSTHTLNSIWHQLEKLWVVLILQHSCLHNWPIYPCIHLSHLSTHIYPKRLGPHLYTRESTRLCMRVFYSSLHAKLLQFTFTGESTLLSSDFFNSTMLASTQVHSTLLLLYLFSLIFLFLTLLYFTLLCPGHLRF
jgi:hypothetical protein